MANRQAGTVGEIDIRKMSLRHFKAALRVAECENVTRAAESLGRSQTAVTKAVSDLERQLGVRLFDRSAKGMMPTSYGKALARRINTVRSEFQKAARAHLRFTENPAQFAHNPIFSMDISLKRLSAFVALFDHEEVGKAANSVGLSTSAIYSSVREMEGYLGLALFERAPSGVCATDYGRILATHVKMAFAEIRHALDDIASLQGVTRGGVAIGTLPLSRSVIVPRAINRLLSEHPQLDIFTRDGPYDVLEVALRSGDLDFILGALRPKETMADLDTEPLFELRLSVIARKGHPLSRKKKLSVADLDPLCWVLPPKNTPSRILFDGVMAEAGIDTPAHCIETSSLATIRGLLMDSDRVALLSRHQIHYDEEYGLLARLPIDLDQTYRPIGITMRARSTLSPAAQLFLDHIRVVARETMNGAGR
ncbi:MAG: LysR family transcriptional regulator [Proteobacteria bacterium]|nr:LysR family transcriptional regulator [Pseudomonadota bacterium]